MCGIKVNSKAHLIAQFAHPHCIKCIVPLRLSTNFQKTIVSLYRTIEVEYQFSENYTVSLVI